MIAEGLTWLPTGVGIVVGGIAMLVTAVLCLVAWRRSGFRRSVAWLEALRFVLVTMVVVTLCQPEWVDVAARDQHPTLTVLYDTSDSMQTRDVLDSNAAEGALQTRAEVIAPLLQESFWRRDEQPMQASPDHGQAEPLRVVFEPFSSHQEPPASGTDLHRGLLAALDSHRDLRGVVLLSDGDWNVGSSPADAAVRSRLRGVPVFAVGIGSDKALPDLALTRMDMPTFGVVRKPVRIPFVVASTIDAPRDVIVTLLVDGKPVRTVSVAVAGNGQAERSLVWTPASAGDFEVSMTVAKDADERDLLNNVQTARLSIRDEQLKVLVLESRPRWEYRYLRNALERDPGVEVSCLLFHPMLNQVGGGRSYLKSFPTVAELSAFDVVFVGDVGIEPGQLTLLQAQQLKNLVSAQASGLVFLPGRYGFQRSLLQSPLAAVYPVVLDAARPTGVGSATNGHFVLTSLGQKSLLTKLADDDRSNRTVWRRLPGMNWRCAALRATAGSEVLAVHDTDQTRFGRVPLIVTKTFGTGKVLFMGTDSAWRWREGVEDTYHYRFWAQVARWMAYQRQMAEGQSMRCFYSPDRPHAGDSVTLYANVLDPLGAPLHDGTVGVETISASGRKRTVRLQPGEGDARGLFIGAFEPDEPGAYKLVATCRETGASVIADLTVQGTLRERRSAVARYDVLREVAEISRGQMLEIANVKSVVAQLARLPEPPPDTRRTRLWAHPAWCGILILLLAVFWSGRKIMGAI